MCCLTFFSTPVYFSRLIAPRSPMAFSLSSIHFSLYPTKYPHSSGCCWPPHFSNLFFFFLHLLLFYLLLALFFNICPQKLYLSLKLPIQALPGRVFCGSVLYLNALILSSKVLTFFSHCLNCICLALIVIFWVSVGSSFILKFFPLISPQPM